MKRFGRRGKRLRVLLLSKRVAIRAHCLPILSWLPGFLLKNPFLLPHRVLRAFVVKSLRLAHRFDVHLRPHDSLILVPLDGERDVPRQPWEFQLR